ncbi:hypothetical protein CPB83DRAFT_840408 [Crepidotus variabilis]|uniref:Uncharacterized protein n=1 Tax=Crepidotus variabilis TaxID=179855 RepID=A0A9P6JIP6_9AGAR|nr:hypothetical protein CPB83DRAFT_840408 [Crepidotus variabilis]
MYPQTRSEYRSSSPAYSSSASTDFPQLSLFSSHQHRNSSTPFSTSSNLPADWEHLDIPDLLRNANVRNLYQKYQGANEKVAACFEDKERLLWQVNELQTELHILRNELMMLKFNPMQNTATAVTQTAPGMASPLFLQPSSSRPAPRSLALPADMPKEVLWTFADAQACPGIVTDTNKCRPKMAQCIRRQNGEIVTANEYSAIQACGKRLVATFLDPLGLPANRAQYGVKKTRTYYAQNFRDIWRTVLEKIEEEEPLVALCANKWKAEYLLASLLRHQGAISGSAASTPGPTIPNTTKNAGGETRKRANVNPEDNKGGTSKRQRSDATSERTRNESDGRKATKSPKFRYTAQEGTNGENAQAEQIPPPTTRSLPVEVQFIHVDQKILSLKDFPQIGDAQKLLNAMNESPNFQDGTPSKNVIDLITRMETADPNASTVDEDNTNASWGHLLYTGGNLIWRNVLTDWEAIGNCATVARLLAAALRTCKIARHLCFERRVDAPSFLSDIYLEQIVEKIWSLWTDASKSVAPPTGQASNAAPLNGHSVVTNSDAEGLAAIDRDRVNDMLKQRNLTKEKLKSWTDLHQIQVVSKKRDAVKAELVTAILGSGICFTVSGFQELLDLVAKKTDSLNSKKGTAIG